MYMDVNGQHIWKTHMGTQQRPSAPLHEGVLMITTALFSTLQAIHNF